MVEKSKILIVDDRRENLIALEKVLEDLSIEIVTVTNGNDALRSLLNHEFALIILDVMMPEMDGYELAELIRGQKETRKTPLIFLTAMGSTDKLIFRGYQAGAVDYLFKPVDDHILLSKVNVFVQLDQQKKELERSNRDLEIFAGIASHDLKAPLRKIQNMGDFLKEDFKNILDERGIQYITNIQGMAMQLSKLTDSLLEYSRINKETESFESVDLNDILERVVNNLELQIQETRGDIRVGKLPVVKGMPFLLIQLFQNLISNALKFHRNEEPPRVDIEAKAIGNGFWKITIKDNGIGFDEKYSDEIFKPFKRLVSKSTFDGSGIGLASCQKIANHHRGNIMCCSEMGKGSLFAVILPE
ncbi:MAG: hybrid sensor histidine kinase/response regulator [Nitrospinae bacterium CG11_big_fil_rev_8_21_14_0_20_45_15]|nr:MAG: hybrid sensor histidine kinase/response regulator [Nitrospinae bacterium CG11_big_fil_rev_8_21_14_0_20_45_15]